MTFTAFWLILFSVVLHVSWNLISKATKPSAAFYFITSLAACLVATPFIFIAKISWGALPAKFWLFFCLTSAANILYYFGLFKTYKKSDISMSYPLIRALPVVFTAVVTSVLGIGDRPSVLAFCGMFVVFCGCLLMPLEKWSDFKLRSYFSPVIGTIILAACGTTGYTILDSLVISCMNDHSSSSAILVSCAYMCYIEGILALGLLPFMLFSTGEKLIFLDLLRKPVSAIICGVFTVSAYVLVLLAMPLVTNVSFVQVFRQMGLPMGVAAGVLILKEKCSAARLVGIVTIVLGLALVAWGK